MAYSSMEEYCATNAKTEVRIFLSRLKINGDLAQLAERYSDTVEVDSSSLSATTKWFVTQLEQSTGLLHREL